MTALLQQHEHATLERPAALTEADLRDLMSAYHVVTDRLQQSHEALQLEVTRLHRELATSNAQLQRSKRLAALGEMAAGIAHEIRNPLAAIQLYAGMVIEDLDTLTTQHTQQAPAPLRFALDNSKRIADAVLGLSAIVNDVLTFARPLDPRVTPVAIEHAFIRALDANRPLLAAARVSVKLDLQSSIVLADADLLHQVLVNLIRNAAEALHDYNGPRTLTLSIHADRQTLTVADTGPGIDAEAADRLFNPFFTTRASGTGLGLAIVHRILDAHGGTVTVHNDPQHHGAVFTLRLPRPAPHTNINTHTHTQPQTPLHSEAA